MRHFNATGKLERNPYQKNMKKILGRSLWEEYKYYKKYFKQYDMTVKEFMDNTFPKAFLTGTYKLHKRELLFEIEKSKLPMTVEYLDVYNELKESPQKLDQIKDEAAKKRDRLLQLQNELQFLQGIHSSDEAIQSNVSLLMQNKEHDL